jgi:hypothetical protein
MPWQCDALHHIKKRLVVHLVLSGAIREDKATTLSLVLDFGHQTTFLFSHGLCPMYFGGVCGCPCGYYRVAFLCKHGYEPHVNLFGASMYRPRDIQWDD